MASPNDSVSIVRTTAGPSGDAAGAAAIFAVIATAAAGDVASPVLARTDGDPTTVYTGGELVLASEIISSYSGQATIPTRATSAAPGAYDAIDNSGFTGTAIPEVEASVVPYLDAEVYVEFVTGGTIGVAADGITYRVSRDGGRTFGARTALGAASYIDVPTVHARVRLEPPAAQETALVTYANAARTAFLAHIIYTTGTVHGAPDSTSDDAIQVACTNTATAITLLATLVAGLSAHMLRGTTVHLVTQSGSSVTAALAAVTAASAAATASGAAQDAVSGFIAFEAALEAHEASTTAHTIADAVNVISATVPTRGTVLADDVIQVATTGPTMDAAGLTAALESLAAYNASLLGGVVVAGAFDPDELWAPLIAGLDALRAGQVPVIALVEARARTDAETPAQYRIALEAEWAAYHDERVFVCPERGRLDPATIARCGAQLQRSHLAPLAARLAALDYGESPGVPKISGRDTAKPSRFGGPLAGFMIYDSAGAAVGHDERIFDGLAPAGFLVTTSYRRAPDPMKPYIYQPKGRAESGSRAPHIAHQRVASVVEGILYTVLTENLESGLLYEPGRSTIRGDVADGLDSQLKNIVLETVGDPKIDPTLARISDLTVLTDRNAVIDPDDPEVAFDVTLTTRFYVSRFTVRLQINRSA